jgi:protein phosphatase PTC7
LKIIHRVEYLLGRINTTVLLLLLLVVVVVVVVYFMKTAVHVAQGRRSDSKPKNMSSPWWPRACITRMMHRHTDSRIVGRLSRPCMAIGLVVGATALYGGGMALHHRNANDGAAVNTTATRAYTSGSPSNQSFMKKMKFKSGVSMLPHPEKEHRGGEDAYFIHKGECCVGVADGVGGWAEVGVDPGLYSRELMQHAVTILDGDDEDVHPGTPQRVLEGAHAKTKARGSCTACIVCLHEGKAHASNLGDSGFMIARNGVVHFISPQQQHEFNFPFQIGSPDSMSDPPSAADTHAVDVKHGDILIAATDGLFDNVFPDEAAALVAISKNKGEDPHTAAELLAKFARGRAADPRYLSPFAYGAQQLGLRYLGGKMDDITVLVAYLEGDDDDDE